MFIAEGLQNTALLLCYHSSTLSKSNLEHDNVRKELYDHKQLRNNILNSTTLSMNTCLLAVSSWQDHSQVFPLIAYF